MPKATDTIPDEYDTMSGETIIIGQDSDGSYWVQCIKGDEISWHMTGRVVEDDGLRQKREKYTRETALAEFNKWRT